MKEGSIINVMYFKDSVPTMSYAPLLLTENFIEHHLSFLHSNSFLEERLVCNT